MKLIPFPESEQPTVELPGGLQLRVEAAAVDDAGRVVARVGLYNGVLRVSDTLGLDLLAQRKRLIKEAIAKESMADASSIDDGLLALAKGIPGELAKMEAARIIAAARKPHPSRPPADEERPAVQVNERFLREIAADGVTALVRANTPTPTLFRRGTALVRVTETEHGPAIDHLRHAGLKGLLDRAADFVLVTQTKHGGEMHTPKRPPDDVVSDILASVNLPFPTLRGVLTTPVFLPSGQLLVGDGYDPASGYLLALRGLVDVRDDMPAGEALRLLTDELFVDFPFADDASRANTIGLHVQPFARLYIAGPTPLFLMDAPTRGTGKGLLADVFCEVACGSPAPVMALVDEDGELEKRITSMLLQASPVVLLDNVTKIWQRSLMAALTTTRWRGRILGKSEIADLPNEATWLATGNNVALSDEARRRVVQIRLDAGVESPEERSDFRHPDLLDWTREQRPELVSACLSLVRAWIDAGRPNGQQTLGRFESWARTIGGILDVAGVPGFLANREAGKVADRETGEWTAFCAAWHERYAALPVTAGDLMEIARERTLLLDLWGGRAKLAALQRLGHALGGRRDRRYGRFYIRAAGRDGATGNAAYRIEIAPDQPPPRSPAGESSGVSGVSGVLGAHPVAGDGRDDDNSQDVPFPPDDPSGFGPDAQWTDAFDESVTREKEGATKTPETPETPEGPTLSSGVSGVSGVLRRHDPRPGDYVNCLDVGGNITNPRPWRLARVETAADGTVYGFFTETTTGWPLDRCEAVPVEEFEE